MNAQDKKEKGNELINYFGKEFDEAKKNFLSAAMRYHSASLVEKQAIQNKSGLPEELLNLLEDLANGKISEEKFLGGIVPALLSNFPKQNI